MITPYPLPANTPNYTAIDISPGCDYWAEGISDEGNIYNLFFFNSNLYFSKATTEHSIGLRNECSFVLGIERGIQNDRGYSTTEYALKHENVQRFLHATDQHYDLILAEQYYQDAFLMFGHKFKAPIVSICKSRYSINQYNTITEFFSATFGWNTYFDSMFGSFGAWAHVPHELYIVPDRMNFWQRLKNVYFCLLDKYARHNVYIPQQQALADKYFAHLPSNFTEFLKLQFGLNFVHI